MNATVKYTKPKDSSLTKPSRNLVQKAQPIDFDEQNLTPEHIHYGEDADSIDSDHGNLEITPELGDNYIGAEILIPRGGVFLRGRVARRKRDANGNPIGRSHDSPALGMQSNIVEFKNYDQAELTANLIAENMYAQCDPDGNQYLILDDIVDHRSTDNAIKFNDQKVVRADGRTYVRQLTFGWQLCCQWIDGSTYWESLNDLKNSHPVETAEHAKLMKIDHEPAFNWWMPHMLKKRNRIISLVRKRIPRYLKQNFKFRIKVPTSVKDALEIDKKNGNTYWANAIATEMKNVRAAFKILPDGTKAPNRYQRINCHMVFDVKMEDFRQKAIHVAGGHMT